MADMATIPVYACRVCGKPVYVTQLTTFGKDPQAEMLKTLMQGLSNVALCDYHRARRNWYASQGREAEFMANEFNPTGVIYNVVDQTDLDYYGRKMK